MAAFAVEFITVGDARPAPAGELCNLLQVAASALHLIDQHLDDEMRPLCRVGLAAIRQAAAAVHAQSPGTALVSTRRIAS